MDLARTQIVLARLYTDAALRERFFIDPPNTGAALGLTDAETWELARLPQQQIRAFARSLHHKRLGAARRLLPLTRRALGLLFDALFFEYAATLGATNAKKPYEEAAGFAEFLRRWVINAGCDDGPHSKSPQQNPVAPWFADLARYEAAWRQATNSQRAFTFCWFRFPVHALARRLTQGEPVATFAPRRTFAVWFRFTKHGRLRHAVWASPL